jgi:ribosomal-protein-alanine N-acetyltransferase
MKVEGTIATASAADCAGIMVIMEAAFDPQFGESWSTNQLRSALIMPHNTVYIWRSSGQGALDAFLIARTVSVESEMLMLAVAPQLRRSGIATILMRNWEQQAAKAGVENLFLEVRASNPALHVYAAAGFGQVGTRRDYYHGQNGTTFDAITMCKNIAHIAFDGS